MPKHLGSHNARRAIVTGGGEGLGAGRVIQIAATDECPDCGRTARITDQGMRRRHRLRNGDDCPGGGIRVQPATFALDLDNLPPIQFRRDSKPPTDLDAPSDLIRGDDVDEPPARRVPPIACPDCGSNVPGRRKNDGTIRRHRIRPQDPFAAWCKPQEDQ